MFNYNSYVETDVQTREGDLCKIMQWFSGHLHIFQHFLLVFSCLVNLGNNDSFFSVFNSYIPFFQFYSWTFELIQYFIWF